MNMSSAAWWCRVLIGIAVLVLAVVPLSSAADSLAQRLHAQIAAVAPIEGVSIGTLNDKTTWRIDFLPTATAAQKAAARAVLAAFDPTPVKEPVALTTDEVLNLLVTKGVLTQKDVDDLKAAKGGSP